MSRTKKQILHEVRALAVEYYELTGKPLGVTGEIGEFKAAELMGLKLVAARTEGYDATRDDGPYKRVQIKSRVNRDGNKKGRVSKIDTSKEFDSVTLVLMRGDYEVHEIWEEGKEDVCTRLNEPGSISRNKRRQMGISQFTSIADKVWPTGGRRMQPQSTRQGSKVISKSLGKKKCPECGHVFQGNGWGGIDAHWKPKHEHIMPYKKARPLLLSGNYKKNVLS